jgi:hypothetical protein
MEERNICQEVFNKIEGKHLKPKPRWEFLAKNYVFWGFFGLSIFIGSMAVSVIIYMAVNNDWDLFERLDGNWVNFIFDSLPYFWLLLLVVFTFVAYYYLRHTKCGYRYSLLLVVGLTVSASIFFGLLSFLAGFGEFVDQDLQERMPLYQNFALNRARMWIQPERGVLAGTIKEFLNQNDFYLVDFTSQVWIVRGYAAIRNRKIKFVSGENLKIVGEKIGDLEFKALDIRPWGRTCIKNNCPTIRIPMMPVPVMPPS